METLTLQTSSTEVWWGGASHFGVRMPFGKEEFALDLRKDLGGNQGAPLLLSSHGRYVWADEPFRFAFSAGNTLSIAIRDRTALTIGTSHDLPTLCGAYHAAQHQFFPPSGKSPDRALFTKPQYNTWMELGLDVSQDSVLAYAQDIVGHGFPPGILLIDDGWQTYYGSFMFARDRFPDPRAMVHLLHEMGFVVMLWVCPFVSPDSRTFRDLAHNHMLLSESPEVPAIREWWNGYSGILDLTHGGVEPWLRTQMQRLMDEVLVDGFKFDGGDIAFYRTEDHAYHQATPHEQSRLWAQIALDYPLNECKSAWNLGGQALGQRLRDKPHTWNEEGLQALIPNGLAQGLLGYAYACPDMIGGGLDDDLKNSSFRVDQELFVRWTQCSALFPMMQFSMAPWRVLDPEALAMCLAMVHLHTEIAEEVGWSLVDIAATAGDPIMRHLAYLFPNQGYESIQDQFLLGNEILVAPVLQPRQRRRSVVFPLGRWHGDDGSEVQGPSVQDVPAPLARLPWYRLQQP